MGYVCMQACTVHVCVGILSVYIMYMYINIWFVCDCTVYMSLYVRMVEIVAGPQPVLSVRVWSCG